MGRYTNKVKDYGGSVSGKWIGLWIVWLFIFIVVLPPIMGCPDVACATAPPSTSLLILWFDFLTLFGAVGYLQFVFGVWAFLVIIGCLDMMDSN